MKGRWDINWLLAPLLSVFAVGPLTHPGYFWGAHDARHSVYFLVEFDRAIQDGIWYPRWMPDFNSGFGYPFFNIYPPGAFYLGEAFHLLGLDFVSAAKLVFGLGIVLSGLTMYLFARRLWGPAGGLVSAVAYMYVPYRLVDVYVRGAQAESLIFAAFPLALWAFDDLCRAPRWRGAALAALSVAALMFCHFPLGLFFVAVLGFYVLARNGPRPGGRSLSVWLRPYALALAAVALGLCLSAVLLAPAVLEYAAVRTDQWAGGYYDYRDHFVEAFQLLAPGWGFGASVPGPDDAMSFQLGAAPLVLAVLAVFGRGLGRRGGGFRQAPDHDLSCRWTGDGDRADAGGLGASLGPVAPGLLRAVPLAAAHLQCPVPGASLWGAAGPARSDGRGDGRTPHCGRGAPGGGAHPG
jgi:hypothetical protein